MKFKHGDQVVAKCQNPATGWIKRVAKDGSWADVRWDAGIDWQYVSRVPTTHLLLTNPLFNKLARDPLTRAMVLNTEDL